MAPSRNRLQSKATCHAALVCTTARPPDLTTCFLFLVHGDLIRLQVAATSSLLAPLASALAPLCFAAWNVL